MVKLPLSLSVAGVPVVLISESSVASKNISYFVWDVAANKEKDSRKLGTSCPNQAPLRKSGCLLALISTSILLACNTASPVPVPPPIKTPALRSVI